MNKPRRIYIIISLFLVALGQLLTHTYRPYIYQNEINDFGFADTIGSLVSVIAFCFFIWGIKGYSEKVKNRQIVITTFIYTFFWEGLGLLGIHGTFDYKDIIAGLISGVITYFLKELIEGNRFSKSADSITK